MNAAVIVGAGTGSRLGAPRPKAFASLCGRPLISFSLESFLSCESVDKIVLVVSPEWLTYCLDEVVALVTEGHERVEVVSGGETRRESVLAGLESLPADISLVAVHDAARPLVSPAHINELFAACLTSGEGVIPVLDIVDTLKTSDDGRLVSGTADRGRLYAAQTPQVFPYAGLKRAHLRARREGWKVGDDSEIMERTGARILMLPGERANMKITFPDDLAVAESIVRSRGCESA